jgi:hypothetical protein
MSILDLLKEFKGTLYFLPLLFIVAPYLILKAVSELESKDLKIFPNSRLKERLAFVQKTLEDKLLEPNTRRVLLEEKQELIFKIALGISEKPDQRLVLEAVRRATPSRYNWKFMKRASRFINYDGSNGIRLSESVRFSLVANVFLALSSFVLIFILGTLDLSRIRGDSSLVVAFVVALELTFYAFFCLFCVAIARDFDLLDVQKRYFARATELLEETKQSQFFDSGHRSGSPQDPRLESFGIDRARAQEIRTRLSPFADVWNDPELDEYNVIDK